MQANVTQANVRRRSRILARMSSLVFFKLVAIFVIVTGTRLSMAPIILRKRSRFGCTDWSNAFTLVKSGFQYWARFFSARTVCLSR